METDARESIEEGGSPKDPTRRKKRLCLWALMVLGVLLGFLMVFVEEGSNQDSVIGFLFGVIFTLFVLFWCHYDAWDRGFKLGRGLALTIVLLMVVGLPVYFFRSRGASEGWLACLKAILFLLLIMLIAVIAALIGSLFFF